MGSWTHQQGMRVHSDLNHSKPCFAVWKRRKYCWFLCLSKSSFSLMQHSSRFSVYAGSGLVDPININSDRAFVLHLPGVEQLLNYSVTLFGPCHPAHSETMSCSRLGKNVSLRLLSVCILSKTALFWTGKNVLTSRWKLWCVTSPNGQWTDLDTYCWGLISVTAEANRAFRTNAYHNMNLFCHCTMN